MVSDLEQCRPGQACIEIMFLGKDLCYEVWSVTGRYVALHGKEWGMIVPSRLNFKAECPGPPL